jgi:hypothetical protein
MKTPMWLRYAGAVAGKAKGYLGGGCGLMAWHV